MALFVGSFGPKNTPFRHPNANFLDSTARAPQNEEVGQGTWGQWRQAASASSLKFITKYMKAFTPLHKYELQRNGVSDANTVKFAEDTLAVCRSLYQGMAPIGEWIQTRVACLIREWRSEEWITSHGQIADVSTPEIQSRSWDIIVHRPIPKSRGYPPPASSNGPYPLVPKDLCRAVVDTKGRYTPPKKYAEAKAFDLPNKCNTKQLDFLGSNILPVLFIMATTHSPARVEAEGEANGISTFALAKAMDRKTSDLTGTAFWHLNQGENGILPLSGFRDKLRSAANQWTTRNSVQSR